MKNKGNIRLFTFDDEQTSDASTGFVDVNQKQLSTFYIEKFPQELKSFYKFEKKLIKYISNLIREYVAWNDYKPVFFHPMNLQDIAGDPDGSGWSIYGFGIIDSEPSVFVIKENCPGYDRFIKVVPPESLNCYSLEVSGVANLYELIRIFINNNEVFEELGLPELQQI